MLLVPAISKNSRATCLRSKPIKPVFYIHAVVLPLPSESLRASSRSAEPGQGFEIFHSHDLQDMFLGHQCVCIRYR